MEDPLTQLASWYKNLSLPLLLYVTASTFLCILCSFDCVHPETLSYTFSRAFLHLQVWRPFTSLFFQGYFTFHFVYSMVVGYKVLTKLQENYERNYADFVWLCMLIIGLIFMLGSILKVYFIGNCFFFALMYIWKRKRPNEQTKLFFGIGMKWHDFFYFYFFFNILMGFNIVDYIVAFVIAKSLFTIMEKYPPYAESGLLRTPYLMKKLFPPGRGRGPVELGRFDEDR